MNRDEEKKIKKLLKGSPNYKDNSDNWSFLYNSYIGGKRYSDEDYLYQHQNESEQSFGHRKDLSAYTNFVEPIVRLYSSYIFKSDIKRDFTADSIYSKVVKEIKENINLDGMDITDFMETLSKLTMVYGSMLTIVDVPFFEGTKSMDESIKTGSLPYAKMYPPTSVLNFKLSPPGLGPRELELLVLKEGEGSEDDLEYFKIWTKNDWMLISREDVEGREGKIEIVKQGVNRLGMIPAINMAFKTDIESDVNGGVSFIEDIATLSKKVYNLDSAAYEIVENVGFPMLQGPAIPGDDSDIIIGTGNVLLFDPNSPSGAKFEYLEPANTSLREILYWRNQVEQDIRNISHTVGVSLEKEAESGAALEARLQGLHSNLGSMAKRLQRTEKEIYKLMGKYMNTPVDIEVVYPKTFNIRDLSTDIDNSIKSKTFITSPEFSKKLEEIMSVKILASITGDESLTDEDKKTLKDDIASRYASGENLQSIMDNVSGNQ